MKKVIFLMMFLSISFSLFGADNKYRLRGTLTDGATTYLMLQKKDSWEATRVISFSTYTLVGFSVGYTSTTATNFWNVITTTTTWYSAQEITSK